jgi:hypothetical protein
MTKITLDPAACDQLGSVDGSAEIRNEKGELLGYFLASDRKIGQPPPGFEVPLSIEETEKRRGARTGRTLDEILRGMGLR